MRYNWYLFASMSGYTDHISNSNSCRAIFRSRIVGNTSSNHHRTGEGHGYGRAVGGRVGKSLSEHGLTAIDGEFAITRDSRAYGTVLASR
jgi:hypothetical protein